MSWLSELSGKAENILNNIDRNAAKALNKRPNLKISTYDEGVLSSENSTKTTWLFQDDLSNVSSTNKEDLGKVSSMKKDVSPDYLRNEMLQNEIHSLNNEISLLLNRVKLAEQKSSDFYEQLIAIKKKNEELEDQLAKVIAEKYSANDITSICKSLKVFQIEIPNKFINEDENKTTLLEHYDKQIQELLQDKTNLEESLRKKEDEIIMLKSRLSQKTYCFSVDELQSRLRALTITLVQKQSSLESITAEKNAIFLKMNLLQKKYDEALGILHQSRINMNDTDDVKAQIPVLRTGTSLKNKLKNIFVNVFRTGPGFQTFSLLRLFIIFYVILMHVLIFLLLHSYMPDFTSA